MRRSNFPIREETEKLMAALADNPSTSATPPTRRLWRWWLLAAVVALALAVGGYFGWRARLHTRQQQLLEKARAHFERQEFREAIVQTQFALRADPNHLEANRLMARLADLAGASQAVSWHRKVTELEPGVLENHLKWAEAALRANSIAIAEQALTGVNEAGKNTAAYHEMAAQVAQALGRPADAEAHFAAAVKLDPGNEKYLLGLASTRLNSADPAIRDEARAAVERYRAKPEHRRLAHRVLIQDHFRRGEWPEGFRIAAELQSAPDAPFDDRLLLLELLRKFKRPELHSYLMDVQEIAAKNPEDVATLISWLNRNTMALIAVVWSRSLSDEIRSTHPVPAAIAESFANLRDWTRLKPMVAEGDWGDLNYMRLALLARVLREQGDDVASRAQWNHAVKAAANRPEALERLAKFASASRWESETTALLWQVARGSINPDWALALLQRDYFAKGNTRGCLNVATRNLELHPADVPTQNNVAAFSLLLNLNMDRALALSREAHTKQPENPAIAATYAYALHQHGKTEEGLKIMRAIDQKFLRDPAFAVYFGVLLADGASREEALEYLDLAQDGKLLPEERALIVETKARLQRRSTEKAAANPP
jgi:predicted Zn-dependent protease